jgi:hypothetical protein
MFLWKGEDRFQDVDVLYAEGLKMRIVFVQTRNIRNIL